MASASDGAWDRRSILRGAAVAAGAGAATPLLGGAATARTDGGAQLGPIPPDTRPGGAYDRYIAKLAAEDRFSGVVLLSHRGRTVLSRSYGMADKEKGIRNHEGVAFNQYGGPFVGLAIVQLAQRGKVKLWNTVGTYLTGFAKEIAEQVRVHHLLVGTSGLSFPERDHQRIFHSEEEQHEYDQQYARQATLVAAPGAGSEKPGWGSEVVVQIVEAVSGMTFWDYVQKHIFERCGMTGSGYYTRPQWLADDHVAHSYMKQAEGNRVDAVRNLDKDSPHPGMAGMNNARNFVPDGGFVTAPDMVRFARALYDGTVLAPAWADVYTSVKAPNFRGSPGFATYGPTAHIVEGQWELGRGGLHPGSSTYYSIYPDSGWIGVILGNYDDIPLQEITGQQTRAITGAAPGDGGG
ncbi:beta-lactamase family protein [Actinomadura sp. NAK00032]|uniref:serine hydrolase domain-containing protein n=1 Tax=Actinomadura sp. NAK00032 TaxID=2742128 RepID=UPI00158FFEBA|nr:serine hydrolase domain-containing protein [Actinomadura sp. NAK00032]QKW39821.1 beta-lactamase family protein [Actinomadura sp. NAK00032]